MNPPLVSIRIITYNHAPYIKQALEGVLMQKVNFTWELIIADDFSTDGTRDILLDYKQKYPDKIKLILQHTNVGAGKNWADLMTNLSSKYTAYFEGDDYWIDENKLQLQVDLLDSNPGATICFNQVKIWNERNQEFYEHWSVKDNIKEKYTLCDILKKYNMETCSVVFRNVYREIPFNISGFPTGDVALYSFLLLKGNAVFLNKVMSVYRMHQAGIYSSLNLENKSHVFLNIYESYLNHSEFSRYYNLIKQLISCRAYMALCFEIKKDQPDLLKIHEYYSKAIKFKSKTNFYFPLKTLLRKNLFLLTGKSFGRSI